MTAEECAAIIESCEPSEKPVSPPGSRRRTNLERTHSGASAAKGKKKPVAPSLAAMPPGRCDPLSTAASSRQRNISDRSRGQAHMARFAQVPPLTDET